MLVVLGQGGLLELDGVKGGLVDGNGLGEIGELVVVLADLVLC